MSIRLPLINNSTPDSVKFTQEHNECSYNKYIWRFRYKQQKGLDLIINPIKVQNSINWSISIKNVEWTGEDYDQDKKELYQHTKTAFDEAINCANLSLNQLIDNNSEYSHIK